MKIGILSLYYKNYNYGGQLQAYALQKVLGRFEKCEQICVDLKPSLQQKKADSFWGRRRNIFFYIRKIPRKLKEKYIDNNIIKKSANKRVKRLTIKRKLAFDVFSENVPHSEIVYSDLNMRELLDSYNVLVIGSDQVWNNSLAISTIEIFSIADKKKCKTFSYAASIGSRKISEDHREVLQKNLENFEGISVREKSAKEQLENILKRDDIQVVCDPVLLLEKGEWDEVAIEPEIEDDYIFCYLLGNKISHKNFARKLARNTGYKIVFFPYIKDEFQIGDVAFGNIRDYSAGPAEFVGYIKKAKVVVTDSFHAMVFSTIYHKTFYVLQRDNSKSVNSMNNRIYDFLREHHLETQLIENDKVRFAGEVNDNISYDKAKKIMEEAREKSIQFIRSNILKI